VTTKTVVEMVTVTRTTTQPGGTTWAKTITATSTLTTGNFLLPTTWVTRWQEGCREWACQL
jgi:hypothetical protein